MLIMVPWRKAADPEEELHIPPVIQTKHLFTFYKSNTPCEMIEILSNKSSIKLIFCNFSLMQNQDSHLLERIQFLLGAELKLRQEADRSQSELLAGQMIRRLINNLVASENRNSQKDVRNWSDLSDSPVVPLHDH